jgi:hypothetical protein
MFWRILTAFGALTFLIGGVTVLTTDDCAGVDFGGNRRVPTYSCTAEGEGDASQPVAGGGMLAVGTAMGTFAVWPLIARSRSQRHLQTQSSTASTDRAPNSGPVTSIDPLLPTLLVRRARWTVRLVLYPDHRTILVLDAKYGGEIGRHLNVRLIARSGAVLDVDGHRYDIDGRLTSNDDVDYFVNAANRRVVATEAVSTGPAGSTTTPKPSTASPGRAADSPESRLRLLNQLHRNGLVTDEEFELKRREVIAQI